MLSYIHRFFIFDIMKHWIFFSFILSLLGTNCSGPVTNESGFASVSRVDSGRSVAVMLTAYSTTLLADGQDRTRLRIAVVDSLSREIISADDTIHVYVNGDGKVIMPDSSDLMLKVDTAGEEYTMCRLQKGVCSLVFVAGTKPDKIKVEARSGKLWPGSHEIHTLPADFVKLTPTPEQLQPARKPVDRMIGADISFLPQIEAQGKKFYENGQEKDAIQLLGDHGFNYIRLRIFVNPENEKGYSPGEGYCGLDHTLKMARRVRDAGMKILLDFHYSDYWADPQQQNKPLAWSGVDFETLKDSVRSYTTRVLLALKEQGTLPAMAQVGNEINHGILWPDGHIANPDNLAGLLMAGVEGIRAVDPELPVMMHIALGGQHDEAVFWLDNMIARGVTFDIIGISYYPRWHGTLDDLKKNLVDLVERYHKPVNVVEYSNFKKEVHEIVFNLPGDKGKGTCIWEPLNWWSGLFTREGEVKGEILVYDTIKKRYLEEE
ncbi:MAG: hypothetical protein D4R67_03450 [Bacteroidetes bacterium]|nr:MAG: hypothetical protein D4R67_03450 [Bacteroidota bacterium]